VQRHPRHRVQLAADVIDAATASVRQAVIVDLSLSGARLCDADPPKPGTEVRLRFTLGDAPLALAGTVVHVVEPGDRFGRPPGIGVSLQVPPAVAAQLRAYLDQVARDNHDEDGASWAPLPSPHVPSPIDL
jgi:hypothetical protein